METEWIWWKNDYTRTKNETEDIYAHNCWSECGVVLSFLSFIFFLVCFIFVTFSTVWLFAYTSQLFIRSFFVPYASQTWNESWTNCSVFNLHLRKIANPNPHPAYIPFPIPEDVIVSFIFLISPVRAGLVDWPNGCNSYASQSHSWRHCRLEFSESGDGVPM